MVAYVVEQLDDVTLTGGPLDRKLDLMSPFVWKDENNYRIMVRGVPWPLGPTDPTGLIGGGSSSDGLTFAMDDALAIIPGPDPFDLGGCEDPDRSGAPRQSVCVVYYTGVDAQRLQGSMILAEGPSLHELTKTELVLKAPPGEGNIKEATLAETSTGEWRLFYEYAANGASRIGMAGGPSPTGPWTVLPDPFGIRERKLG